MAILKLLSKVVPHDGAITPDDLRDVLDAGVTKEGIKEALHAAWAFMNLSKWADSLDFPLPTSDQLKFGGKALYKMGYKLSSLWP